MSEQDAVLRDELEQAKASAENSDVYLEREGMAVEARSFGRQTWDRLRRHKAAVPAAVLLLLMTLAFFIVPYFLPWDYQERDLQAIANKGISASHPFGADAIGRDLLARVMKLLRRRLIHCA